MDPKEAWSVVEVLTQPRVKPSRTDYARCEMALVVLKALIEASEAKSEKPKIETSNKDENK